MSDVKELLQQARERVIPPADVIGSLYRRRDRKARERRVAAAVVAIIVTAVTFVSLVRAFQAAPRPAVEPRPTPTSFPSPTQTSPALSERVGFIGLPPEGASPSTPVIGQRVVSLNGSDADGVHVDLYVYADGRVVWQRWSDSTVPVDVPEGAGGSFTGYLEQRLTPRGVELLRSRVISTGLFEHSLSLDAGARPLVQVLDGGRLVSVSGYRGKGTRAQTFVRLETLLADPGAWLPADAWADRTIRAYVASRYFAIFDRGKPSPSELPSPADELLLKTCQIVTTDEARAISDALERSGVLPSPNPEVLAYQIGKAPYLHFHPALPDAKPCGIRQFI